MRQNGSAVGFLRALNLEVQMGSAYGYSFILNLLSVNYPCDLRTYPGADIKLPAARTWFDEGQLMPKYTHQQQH
jgi:hypothetical protein